MSSVVLSDILIEETLEVVEQAAEINAGAGNINEQNALVGGVQAVEINADATDNLEVGEKVATIQAISNDNEVEEECSQELAFKDQPLTQIKCKTELQLTREDYKDVTQSIREMSENSRKRQEAFAKAMSDSNERYEEQMREIDRKFNRRLQERIQAEQESNRVYQQQMIEAEN